MEILSGNMYCKICFEHYTDKLRKPESLVPCGHTFCRECLSKMSNKYECPTCKKRFTSSIVVWDLIPSTICDSIVNCGSAISTSSGTSAFSTMTTEETRLYLKTKMELKSLANQISNVAMLNRDESDQNRQTLANIERAINLKAEELINRVMDEQNVLLGKLKSCKIYLDQRKFKNEFIESYAKSRHELIAKQFASLNIDNLRGDVEQVQANIKQASVKVDKLKKDIEEFAKEDRIHFKPKSYQFAADAPLLGTLTMNTSDKSTLQMNGTIGQFNSDTNNNNQNYNSANCNSLASVAAETAVTLSNVPLKNAINIAQKTTPPIMLNPNAVPFAFRAPNFVSPMNHFNRSNSILTNNNESSHSGSVADQTDASFASGSFTSAVFNFSPNNFV